MIKDLISRHKISTVVVAGCLILLAVLIVWKKQGTNGIAYQEVTVTRGDIQSSILSTGIVQPENRLEIKPPIAGRTDEVLVDEGDVVKKGQMLVKMSSTERAALLDAARARGAGELKRWEAYYRPAPILAPIDGTIILRSVEPGQTVTNQDAVLVMSDRLTVKAQVDETDIASIKPQQKAEVVLDAYSDKQMSAQVDKIAYDAKTVNNVTTYIVDVLPESTPAYMKSGMTANVSFMLDSKENVLILPSNAVRNRDGKNVVLVPAPNHMGKPLEKPVEVGISDGKRVEIISGVEENEVVLVDKMKTNNGATKSTNPFAPRH
jgi:membrane fusion protein, macrolide-specific efflux system